MSPGGNPATGSCLLCPPGTCADRVLPEAHLRSRQPEEGRGGQAATADTTSPASDGAEPSQGRAQQCKAGKRSPAARARGGELDHCGEQTAPRQAHRSSSVPRKASNCSRMEQSQNRASCRWDPQPSSFLLLALPKALC